MSCLAQVEMDMQTLGSRVEYHDPCLLSKWSAYEDARLESELVVCGFPVGGFYDHLTATHQTLQYLQAGLHEGLPLL